MIGGAAFSLYRFLAQLTEVPQPAEELSAALGIRAGTVQQLAEVAQAQGAALRVTAAGYALAPGTPAPKLLPLRGHWGQAARYYGELSSTQDVLRAWADDPANPAPGGAVVVAERQTAGRGRRGRPWQTGSGNLVFSVLLQGLLDMAALPTLPLAAGVALQRAAGGWLKWPNDLLDAQGRKVAGVLLEAERRGVEVQRAVLGIGVNVTQAPPGAGTVAAAHPNVTRAALLADILAELEDWLAAPTPAVLDAWREVSATLGRRVRYEAAGELREGQAEDLDAAGSLLVREGSGELYTVTAGDVALIGDFAE